MTMIEIMVVFALVVILVSLGYYSMRKGIVRQRLRGAVDQLRSDVIYVRQKSFATSQYMGIIKSSDGKRYHFVILDSLPAYFDTLKTVPLPSGVKFGNIFGADVDGKGIDGTLLPQDGLYTSNLTTSDIVPSSADNWILFTPRGTLAWGEKKYVYITNGEQMYGLRVNSWGKIDIYTYSGGDWIEIH